MKFSNIHDIAVEHNVTLNVIDLGSGKIVQHHEGHNAATNSLILGIGKYLAGNGSFNQVSLLNDYLPQYISLGTLGLSTQNQDADGLPTGIGPDDPQLSESDRFVDYMMHNPGYGADGYSSAKNNGRLVFGLGYPFTNYSTSTTYRVGDWCMYHGTYYTCIIDTYGSWNPRCWQSEHPETRSSPHQGELISPTFPRVSISYRDIVAEQYSELPCTVDVVYSAMISTGALRQFRYGSNDYIFISEAGLWSKKTWTNSGANGLVAGYRIAPPNQDNWDMTVAANRQILKENILRVGVNQVVQVVWKIQ